MHTRPQNACCLACLLWFGLLACLKPCDCGKLSVARLLWHPSSRQRGAGHTRSSTCSLCSCLTLQLCVLLCFAVGVVRQCLVPTAVLCAPCGCAVVWSAVVLHAAVLLLLQCPAPAYSSCGLLTVAHWGRGSGDATVLHCGSVDRVASCSCSPCAHPCYI